MAREQAMFAVSHCRYGVVNQRFKKKCRNGPGLGNGTGTFEKATTLRVQQSIRTIQGWLQSLLATFWMPWTNNEYFCFIDCFIFMAGTPSPKRKIRISDDHWYWTNNELTSLATIFAKKCNIPCSDRVYSYIPSLTFDSQQVRHRT